jgi:ribokinase
VTAASAPLPPRVPGTPAARGDAPAAAPGGGATPLGARRLHLGVIGHVEHVTLGRVPALPGPGDIVHLDEPFWIPGGGGGVTFFQLLRSPGDVVLFTAIGNDSGGDAIAARLAATHAAVHAVRRPQEHTRDLVLLTPDGERTIMVIGKPLQPERADRLPWNELAGCDAVYFTAQDPALFTVARAARLLVVSARRRAALVRSGVQADVVVGSAKDPREASRLTDYPVPPRALVMTEGAAGGRIETAEGIERFDVAPAPSPRVAAYGAGDSFVGALTWYLACGLPLRAACARAARHGAAVLRGLNALESQLPLDWPTD